MKLRLILAISIVVNLALAGAYFVKRTPAASQNTSTETAPPAGKASKSDRERRAQLVTVGGTNAFHWGSVESDDYRQFIANLRAIGCPEETIRDIVIADINKLYAGRIAAVYPSAQDFKFWQTDDRSNRTEQRDRERKRRALEDEKRELIKELLGVDYEREMAKWDGRPDDDAWRLGFLSPEKQAAVQAFQDKFREMERAMFNELRENRGSPEARAKVAAMRAQREAELAQILGPQDYQEYQLRNSFTARNMRDNLASFSPTEDEFRKIFEARKAFDDQFGFTREGRDETVREQRRLAQQQLDDSLRATLGEERFRQYQMAQDERYRDIHDFTQRFNLPEQTAQSMYDIQQTAQAQRQQVLNDPNIPQDQRVATLTQMADEVKNTLKATLTPEAYEQYLRSNPWVRQFTSTDTGGGGRGGPGGFGGGGFQGGPRGGGERGRYDRRN
jgi:hypothetical protein